MTTFARTLRRATRGRGHILDLTGDVRSPVRESGVGTGAATLMVVGDVPLGTWQQMVLVDLDTRPRDRSIVVPVTGE